MSNLKPTITVSSLKKPGAPQSTDDSSNMSNVNNSIKHRLSKANTGLKLALKVTNKLGTRKPKQELLILTIKDLNLFEEWVLDRFRRQRAIQKALLSSLTG